MTPQKNEFYAMKQSNQTGGITLVSSKKDQLFQVCDYGPQQQQAQFSQQKPASIKHIHAAQPYGKAPSADDYVIHGAAAGNELAQQQPTAGQTAFGSATKTQQLYFQNELNSSVSTSSRQTNFPQASYLQQQLILQQ